jgi:hypothetical protein
VGRPRGVLRRAGRPHRRAGRLPHPGQPTDRCWQTSRDRLLIIIIITTTTTTTTTAAADALHDTADIPDELWAELSVTFTEPQLLDLLLLAGWYHAISYVARATRLPPEPHAPTFAALTA